MRHDRCIESYENVRNMRRVIVDKININVKLFRYYGTWFVYGIFSWSKSWGRHRMRGENYCWFGIWRGTCGFSG